MLTILTIVCEIIASVAWFFCGYFVGKKKVYKKWSDWLDRMSEIQKGCRNEQDNLK